MSYCCDWKAQVACAQSFTLWQQATIEITQRDHSIIACLQHIYGCSSHTSGLRWIAHSLQRQQKGCNTTFSKFFFFSLIYCSSYFVL